MKTGYVIWGTLVCLILGYANHTGWTVSDSVKSGKWGPKGHSLYHK